MRLFTAIRPSPGFQAALTDLQERLRAAGVTGRYREPDGLHLTLAFIGDWPEDVTEYLPAVQKPFSITLSHLGIFPDANVLWAGVAPSEELDRLAKQVRHSLADEGIPFDRKKFCPHPRGEPDKRRYPAPLLRRSRRLRPDRPGGYARALRYPCRP